MTALRDLTLAFEPLSAAQATLGESPVWSPEDGCVWWVDVSGRTLFRTRAEDGRTNHWPMPEQVGFVVRMAGSRVALGLESGLFQFDWANGDLTCLVEIDMPGARFNDAATDSTGRLWAGTVDLENRRPVGTIYRISPDLSVSTVVTGLVTTNGLAVDDTRGRLYVSDSHPDVRTAWVADLDMATGTVGDRRVLAHGDDLQGRPDGGAVDEQGNYWLAGVGGGALQVFDVEGRRTAVFPTPCDDPTKIAFGGPEMTTLFLSSKAGPRGGGRLMVAQTPVRGQGPYVFG